MTRRHAHVFVVRDGQILTLHEASGSRWWGFPGGELDPGETPQAAAVRETLEETGLRIGALDLLREWSYRNRRDDEVACYAFAGESPSGDVRLSDEHTAFAWIPVDDYVERYCSERLAGIAPPWAAVFLAEMRRNCELFRTWQQARNR